MLPIAGLVLLGAALSACGGPGGLNSYQANSGMGCKVTETGTVCPGGRVVRFR